MTDKEKIKSIIELFIAWNGETEVIDIANLDSAVDFIIDSLQEEPVNEELEDAAREYACNYTANSNGDDDWEDDIAKAFKAGVQWIKYWKANESVDFFFVHSSEEVAEIDKRIERKQKECDAKLRDRMMRAKDFPMTD